MKNTVAKVGTFLLLPNKWTDKVCFIT